MVLKRKLTEEGNDYSHSSIQKQNTGQEFRNIVEYFKQEDFEEIVANLEPFIRRVVQQELEAKLGFLQSFQRCFHVDQPESCASRTFQLCFTNKLPSTLFTNSKIHAEGHFPLTIQLIDSNSREVINYVPFGSVRVEIVVLNGDFVAVDELKDWNNSSFKYGIVHERDGKRPLLVGELSFSLTQGVGSIKNITLTDNSSWVRSRKFRLGVRAVPNMLNGIGIKEGVSEPFVVLDHRGESYQKHDTPCLDDPVWRLRKISKNGAIRQKLAEKGIHTVKEFLQLYHINPKLLREILGSGVANKAWKTMIGHAHTCCLDDNLYTYYDATYGLGLLLNCVYKVLEVTFDGINYQTIDALNTQQMLAVDILKQWIYANPNLLCLRNDSVCGPSLDPWGSGITITDQGKSLGMSYSDTSCSNRYMGNDSYQWEEDVTVHGNQHFEGAIWGSSSQLTNEYYSVNPTVMTLPSTTPLLTGESFPPQPSWQSIMTTWATSSSSDVRFSSLLQGTGINLSGGGKRKAHWGKIRALFMWKMVKRVVDAKRKAKFPPCYHQNHYA